MVAGLLTNSKPKFAGLFPFVKGKYSSSIKKNKIALVPSRT